MEFKNTSMLIIVFCISFILFPIFIIFDIREMDFYFVKNIGSQDIVYNREWGSSSLFIFPISFCIIFFIGLISLKDKILYKLIYSNKIFLIILLYSSFLIIYSYFNFEYISSRNLKSLVCINYFIFLIIFFKYLKLKYQINREFLYKSLNLVILLIIISHIHNYVSYDNQYNFFWNYFANYQYDTYFLYSLFLLSFFNLQSIAVEQKKLINIYHSLNFTVQIIFFSYISLNNNISGIGALAACLVIIMFLLMYKFKNNLKIIFINGILLNLVFILILISPLYIESFYGQIGPLDERSRIFFRFLENLDPYIFFGYIKNEYKMMYDGASHNDLLEIFLTIGIVSIFFYYFIFENLLKINNYNFIISSIISLIFVAGLTQNNLMSLYLLPILALTFVFNYKNE